MAHSFHSSTNLQKANEIAMNTKLIISFVITASLLMMNCNKDNPTSPIPIKENETPTSNFWTKKADLPIAMGTHTAVVNGKIYVIGGQSGRYRDESVIYPRADVYDPATNEWTTATDMPTARRDLRSEVLDGKIYVFGGRQYGEGLTTTEMYDPETDTWDTTKADMIIGRYYHTSSILNGKIYAVSGVTEAQSDVTAIGKPIGDHEDYTK